MATAGERAACWIVPQKSPTAEVSIRERTGEQSQTPIAGTANFTILLTLCFSSIVRLMTMSFERFSVSLKPSKLGGASAVAEFSVDE